VELSVGGVLSLVRQFFPDPPPAKQLYICPSNSIEELADKIKPHSTSYGLFLATGAQGLDAKRLGEPAARLLKMGLAYLCAWGPDCERVHDIFDEEDLARDLRGDLHDMVMTTWHRDESLEEALWFFVHSAFPADGYVQDCTDWVIAPIANTEWEQEIRERISRVAFELPAE
jgi:hypothetical protein